MIIGGFMSIPRHYDEMAAALAQLSGWPSLIVPLTISDWLKIGTRGGWRKVLDKSTTSLREVAEDTDQEIVIVAHSLGGIVARMIMDNDELLSCDCRIRNRVSAVLTLGTPHQRGIVAALLQVNFLRRAMKCDFSEKRMMCVAGSVDTSRSGYRRKRMMCRLRHRLHGAPRFGRGDGVIPVDAALPKGGASMLLEGVYHDSHIGRPWFGDAEIVPLWWKPFEQRYLTEEA